MLRAPEILTERLRLNRLVASDAPDMFAYRSLPDVCRFQNFEPGSLADVEGFLVGILHNDFDTPGTWFQFAIRHRGTGRLVGDLGTRFPADDPHQVEIGITLAPAVQGRGLAAEAVAGVLDFLFVECGKHRVFASVDPRNESSVKLLRRVGMRQEAHFVQSLWFKGEWADDVVFGILAGEWRRGPRA